MSPIRPENRARYPKNWGEIVHTIMDRASYRCECLGECGCTHVGEEWRLIRDSLDFYVPASFCLDQPSERCPNRHNWPSYERSRRVVLTTAHLNHTPEDCRPENLRAYCQGCHNRYDAEHRAETRKQTREAAQRAAGVYPLIEREAVT